MTVWGIVPAAGRGSRIQPLAFSKELLPVGSRLDGGVERPCAVSEYLLDRMVAGGSGQICMVISPGKHDILAYYGAGYAGVPIVYVVQPQPSGLCDAVFRATPLVRPDDSVIVGLPDTVWFPQGGFAALPDDALAFLLFPVERPELFDAVVTGPDGSVREIQVKRADATSRWIWGRSRCRARCSTPSTRCGWSASGGTSSSARWSTPSSRAAGAPSASGPARATSTPAPSTATAPR